MRVASVKWAHHLGRLPAPFLPCAMLRCTIILPHRLAESGSSTALTSSARPSREAQRPQRRDTDTRTYPDTPLRSTLTEFSTSAVLPSSTPPPGGRPLRGSSRWTRCPHHMPATRGTPHYEPRPASAAIGASLRLRGDAEPKVCVEPGPRRPVSQMSGRAPASAPGIHHPCHAHRPRIAARAQC